MGNHLYYKYIYKREFTEFLCDHLINYTASGGRHNAMCNATIPCSDMRYANRAFVQM